MQYITVCIPNSVHLNQIMPSTTTTVSMATFRRNILPHLIPWRLSSGPCANLRTFRNPRRNFHAIQFLPFHHHPSQRLSPAMSLVSSYAFSFHPITSYRLTLYASKPPMHQRPSPSPASRRVAGRLAPSPTRTTRNPYRTSKCKCADSQGW